uniref:K Homology domain-containing protein n=1 Tax=Kalanchoe fedtschenkoi TaxID=63787 RepID=A0A7N0T564_KALFE
MDSQEKKNEPSAGSKAGLLATVSSGISFFGNAVHQSVITLLGKEGVKVTSPQAGKEKDAAATDESKQEVSSNCTKPSTAALRLLCPALTAGGVIGHGGRVVQNMERELGVRIKFSAAVPRCGERIATVVGSTDVCRTVRLRRRSCQKGEVVEEEEVVQVSAVQEALLGVFERMLEVEGQAGGGATVSCRLLADEMQSAILLGKCTRTIFNIFRPAGASFQILSAGENPACASPADRIVNISGEVFVVMKALLTASEVLQDHPPMRHGPVVTRVQTQASPDPNAGGSAAKETGRRDSNCSAGQDDKPCNVVFKMICSNNEAKAVIGKGWSTMTSLQNESGAFIRFGPAVGGHRIATISAMEGFRSSYSQAQNAVVRIVAKLAEVTARESYGCTPERITVRLVITPAQADRFRHKEFLLSEIRDAEIQILEGHGLGLASLATDKILSVAGEYMAVQKALLRVTKEIRDGYFSSSSLEGAGAPNGLSCAIPDIDTSGKNKNKNSNFITRRESFHKPPGISPESKTSGESHVQGSNGSSGHGHLPQRKENGRGKMLQSDPQRAAAKVTVQVEVPAHAFDSVWGVNGANILRIREISAADVQVQAPPPPGGQTKHTVVVSGEPIQVLAAQSLLQAFIQDAS